MSAACHGGRLQPIITPTKRTCTSMHDGLVIDFAKAELQRASTALPHRLYSRQNGQVTIRYSQAPAGTAPDPVFVLRCRSPPACRKGAGGGKVDYVLQNRPIIVWSPPGNRCQGS